MKPTANVNLAANGATALLVAAGLTGNTEVFRRLLDAGTDVHAVTANGGTVIGAAVTGEPERVALLLARGADANRPFVLGGVAPVYPLQLAVGSGAREIVELLVSHHAGLNDYLRAGVGALPPLSQAVKNGQLAMVDLLISMGANVNQADGLGMTPLLWSSVSDFGSTSVAETLLAAGADPAALDNHHATALQLAERFQFSAMARLLAQRPQTAGR